VDGRADPIAELIAHGDTKTHPAFAASTSTPRYRQYRLARARSRTASRTSPGTAS
jgi:hypothetical protein